MIFILKNKRVEGAAEFFAWLVKRFVYAKKYIPEE